MKYTLILSALAAIAAAAGKPKFLNNDFQIIEGQPFTVKFDCADTCTIILQDGPQNDLKNKDTLTTTATGGSFVWTPTAIPSGTYALKIVDNVSGEDNYSQQFSYMGTGATVTASGASTTGSSTGSASPSAPVSATEVSSLASSTASSIASETEVSTESKTESRTTMPTMTSVTNTTAGSSTLASSTTSRSSTSTRSTTTAATTVPNAGIRATPMALVAGVIAALAYLG